MSEPFKVFDCDLELTCGACPEQYDVLKDGECVGYLRLRHGHFRAHVGGSGGPVVYEAQTRGDGIFDADERDFYLRNAVAAIQSYKEPRDGR